MALGREDEEDIMFKVKISLEIKEWFLPMKFGREVGRQKLHNRRFEFKIERGKRRIQVERWFICGSWTIVSL